MTNVLHTDRSDRGFVLGNNVLAAEVFAKNGFLVFSSVTGEEQTSEVNADQIDQDKGGNDSCTDRASTSGQPHGTADNVLLLQARSGDQRAGGASQVTGHGSRAVRAARLVLALALRKEDMYITCGPFHNREQTLVLACSTSLNGHTNDSLSGLSSRAQTLHRLVQKRSCHKK